MLAFGLTFLRAAWLQGVRASSFGRLASSQHSEDVVIPAARGTIYDRGGVQLAIGEQAQTVYADPRQVNDPQREALVIARTLRLDPATVYHSLSDRTRGFVYVARKADPALVAKLRRKGLPGINSYGEERRFYPQFSLASQVLGYAGVDNRGLAGLELSLDQRPRRPARPRAGRQGRLGPADRHRRLADGARRPRRLPDARPHDPGERAGRAARHRAALAREERDRDRARPDDRRRAGDGDRARASTRTSTRKVWRVLQRNRAVTDTYEPGSTFKLVTVAGALSEGLVTPTRASRFRTRSRSPTARSTTPSRAGPRR